MGSRSRTLAPVLTAALAAAVGCSVAVDTGGLAGGQARGPGDAGADGRSSSSSSGGGDGGGSSGADGGGCDRVKLTIVGCDSPSYAPKGASSTLAVRAAPEVLVYGHHNGSVFGPMIIDDRRTEPHHLVLAAHDSTKWQVTAKKPSAILSVVLTGYLQSTAEVPSGVTVRVGAARTPDAYDTSDPEYEELVAYARSETGASSVTAFAGCHDADQLLIEDGCP